MDYYRIAIHIYSDVHSADPDNADSALQLAGAFNDCAKRLVVRGSFDDANEMFHKSLR